MKTIELDFEVGQNVWFMYNNKPTNAPIWEIKICKDHETQYWFWWQDVVISREFFDTNIHTGNSFKIHVDDLFESKQELIESL